jgi:hypothetical protein
VRKHNKGSAKEKTNMSSSLKTSIEKIKFCKLRKKNLLVEIEGHKKMADAKQWLLKVK